MLCYLKCPLLPPCAFSIQEDCVFYGLIWLVLKCEDLLGMRSIKYFDKEEDLEQTVNMVLMKEKSAYREDLL